MKNVISCKSWKAFLYIAFVVVLVHFLKDITQDILKIPTFLDYLGNIEEDISTFPVLFRDIFVFVGYLSFGVELVILFLIPKAIREKEFSKYDRIVLYLVILLILYFVAAALLDPNIRNKLLLL